MKTYAKVEWSPEDVLAIRAGHQIAMSLEEASEFLQNNQRYIQDAMVEYGWEVIRNLLKEEDK